MTERVVHLRGGGISVALGVGDVVRLLYWGPALPDGVDEAGLRGALPPSGLDAPMVPPLLPVSGWGFWGQPALSGRHATGGWAPRLRVASVDASTTRARIDHVAEDGSLAVALTLDLDTETGVLRADAEVVNRAAEPYRLDWCAALCLPLPAWLEEALVSEGTYIREFQERRVALGMGVLLRENRRGRTSHDAFPGLVLGERGFGAAQGTICGFHLGWSGNHRLSVETRPDGTRIVQLGELLHPGEVVLAPGEAYRTPPAYAALAEDGLNGLMARTHAHVRRRILPRQPMPPRPVHLNIWEAIYFGHERGALLDLIDRAARVGVERFVIDDGWFHGRVNERAGLGDWWPDAGKYPDGLAPIADAVRTRGMDFGLWVEPENVNPDSDLFRAHPDWILELPQAADPARPPAPWRQYVLDLGRAEVADYLFEKIDALLRPGAIAYLKWDMNRDIAPAAVGGEPAWGRHVRALYALIDRLRTAHPDVEIETCASGGGRADWGILERTERVWASDSNDAHDRLAIQRGFGLFFPPEVMGAHVGRERCTVTGRRNDLGFRAAVALFGHMGVEWDIRALDDSELADLAAWIALHKRHRALLHGGRSVRLDLDGVESTGHGVVSEDRRNALFLVARLVTKPVPIVTRLPGLDPEGTYVLRVPEPVPEGALPWGRESPPLGGRMLGFAGVRVALGRPDTAVVFEVERVG
ncbi:alpha-galactosidase [Azospirillum canadense]|uniref:alpha-galactosidase n=1 Tax=Azospirillum canadense TaxID=403962 RepID=UPI00222761C7|nr:alpha-galactosidase [Azospirillum canadense]MCW2235708.1 alpha-galactosidase [Azospirillum canadense]